MSYAQRLSLMVHSAKAPASKANFPYGFHAYAQAAAKCKGKRLSYDLR